MKGKLDIQSVKISTRWPKEFIRLLDSLEDHEIPIGLSQWARKVFSKGRELKIPIDEIGELTQTWAEERHYHPSHISIVLRANGYKRSEQDHSDRDIGSYTKQFRPKDHTLAMKGMVQSLSGLEQSEILRISSTDELIRKSQKNLNQLAARMDEGEILSLRTHITNLKALLDGLDSVLKQKIMNISKLTE